MSKCLEGMVIDCEEKNKKGSKEKRVGAGEKKNTQIQSHSQSDRQIETNVSNCTQNNDNGSTTSRQKKYSSLEESVYTEDKVFGANNSLLYIYVSTIRYAEQAHTQEAYTRTNNTYHVRNTKAIQKGKK